MPNEKKYKYKNIYRDVLTNENNKKNIFKNHKIFFQ